MPSRRSDFPTYGIDIGPGLMQPDDGVALRVCGRTRTDRPRHADFSCKRAIDGAGDAGVAARACPEQAYRRLLGVGAAIAARPIGGPVSPMSMKSGCRAASRLRRSRHKQAQSPFMSCRTRSPCTLPLRTGNRATRRTPFTALAIFNMASSFARKNPIAAIAAFRMAFGNDPTVRLIVKCSNMAAYPKGTDELRHASISAGNITLLEEIMSAAEIADLYAKADVLLSLHRSKVSVSPLPRRCWRGCRWSQRIGQVTLTF